MEPKKNPQLDLRRNSLLYFFVGMTLVLLMAYLALELKTYYQDDSWDVGELKVDDQLIEDATILKIKLPEPPKPKIQTPPKIEIKNNDEKIEETVIEASDTNQDTEIAKVEDVAVAEDDIPEEIPFILIENAPIFPGCENENTEKEKRDCFQEMIQKHIRKNFRYPDPAKEMGLQGRVSIMFTIDKDGSINNLRLRGPHESLEKEAARIISKLPEMKPGEQRGIPVKVSYSLPITFKLN
ncbi:MAG TPA: energy transducer TonB [Muricauda sp.]|uniref:Energy transducer TonB n=1 Tax=Flagellimonas aurea TaxID=2915619 RepID=A0ABS3G6U1_9FLAO|nr:energy transducer TonB [Allomuricauda aurea]MAO17461.1 energy transducer TonB [Allomuricauda sp.]MBC71303.1 energy transducer TonB [Allomuricauda sp.]MBO0354566.1 energy transducer TonB [Allomuricauda aurea]HBU79918.1 energy transducer TonB [Allomuricauda sp.]|tara:strand:- start:106 stop:822 length:717 start_codon:yes stop_codon:yes gene_type:complete